MRRLLFVLIGGDAISMMLVRRDRTLFHSLPHDSIQPKSTERVDVGRSEVGLSSRSE